MSALIDRQRRLAPRLRLLAVLPLLAVAALFAGLAWRRFATFHNQTFDLAFYARIAWGIVHAEIWEPIVGALVLGLHLSFVLIPLGVLGSLFGTVPVLLLAQSLAVTLAVWPLARIGARRFGPLGAWTAAAGFLLHPNLGHVATFEFHPGTVAVLPIAWALDAYDRGHLRSFVWACLGVLACREDLGLMVLVLGALFAQRHGSLSAVERRRLWRLGIGTAVYVALFALVLLPIFGPEQGSMQAHFGEWRRYVGEPALALQHFLSVERLLYLPKVVFPLGGLALAQPRLLLAVLPLLGMNLLSGFPGTLDLDSHYLTPALPVLVMATLDGIVAVGRPFDAWVSRALCLTVMLCVALSFVVAGALPPGRRFDAASFGWDDEARAAAAIVRRIPPGVGVQAPDRMLSHLAERKTVHRAPPPEHDAEYVVLDVSYRATHAHEEFLLRTDEEPVTRSWLARSDFGLVEAAGPYLLLRRGADPRQAVASRYLIGQTWLANGAASSGVVLTACLAIDSVRYRHRKVELNLLARGACAADLAIRLGTSRWPAQVDLLFDGLLSPAHLRAGDVLQSTHYIGELERGQQLWIGVLRSSGARPEPDDPYVQPVAVEWLSDADDSEQAQTRQRLL